MSTRATSALLAVVACGAVLAACGGDDEGRGIPRASASTLQRQLDSILSRFEAGDAACRDVLEGDDTNRDAVQKTLDALSENVDQDVRNALRDSFDRLFELVDEECQPREEETTPTEPTPPPTVETEPETETQTETTETAPAPKPKKEEKRRKENAGGQPAPEDGGGAIAPGGE